MDELGISPVFLLLMAGALAAITAIAHSVLGEMRLIQPILAAAPAATSESDGGILNSPLARAVLRAAWHWTSMLWLVVAGVLALSAYGNISQPVLLWAIGGVHLAAGLADGILTRGRHIGWPLISLVGGLTLLAVYLMQQDMT